MVNGAGLAMATMDIIKLYGGEPANFLDVGRRRNKEKVTEAFKIILTDRERERHLRQYLRRHHALRRHRRRRGGRGAGGRAGGPLVVRLEGTNVKLGKEILNESGLNIVAADSMADGAQKIVALVK